MSLSFTNRGNPYFSISHLQSELTNGIQHFLSSGSHMTLWVCVGVGVLSMRKQCCNVTLAADLAVSIKRNLPLN